VVKASPVVLNKKTCLADLQELANVVKYGGLAEKPLNPEEFEPYRIMQEAFEQVWESTVYRRFPEIVCTSDTLWGQPRLDGRRLAVGDIVSLVDIHDDLSIVLKEWPRIFFGNSKYIVSLYLP
jgi:hypothetical protein